MYLMSTEGLFIPSDNERIWALKEQIRRGNLEHILISQDVCFKICSRNGAVTGTPIYWRTSCPGCAQEGITEEQINTILIENPKRFLSW